MAKTLKTQLINQAFFYKIDRTLLTWLGMAGTLINTRGTIILMDPVISAEKKNGEMISEAGYKLKIPLPIEAKDIPRADIVLYTHADADHFGKKSAQVLDNHFRPKFMVTPPVEASLKQIGVKQDQIVLARDFESLSIGSAEIVVTPALHDWQKENPWKRGECCGYLLKTPDGTIWHPGDTRLINELLTIRDVDVLLFDVASVNAHLGPKGSAEIAKSCKAKKMIAYHYGTFDVPKGSFGGCDPKEAQPFVKNLNAEFLVLNPGEIFKLSLTSNI